MTTLTPPQERFCRWYVRRPNATAAYRKAYPDSSPKAAESSASALLRNPKVAARVAELQQKAAAKEELTAEWVLRRLKKESTYRGEDSSASARVAALKLLGQHLDLFKDRTPPPQPVTVVALTVAQIEHLELTLFGGPAAGTPAGDGPQHLAPGVGGVLPAPLPDPPAEPVPHRVGG